MGDWATLAAMAGHRYITTDAPKNEVLAVFERLFFSRPQLKDRFKLSKGAQLRSQQTWGRTSVPEAEVAAVLERGGLREAISDSRRGTGSAIGMILAMSFEEQTGATVAQLWLSATNTFFGLSQNNDVVKAYAKLIADELQRAGFSATQSKR